MRKMNKQPKSIKKREADEQVERARMIKTIGADECGQHTARRKEDALTLKLSA